MEKAKVKMTNWELYVHDGRYNLSGTADNHPKLGRNVYIDRTSSMRDYKMEKDTLIYETRNTIYICPLKYMSTYPYVNVVLKYKLELTHLSEDSDSELDRIISASAKLSLQQDKKHPENLWFHDEFIELKEIKVKEDEYLSEIKKKMKIGQKEIKEAVEKENARLMEIAKQYDDCVYLEVSCIFIGDKLAYHIAGYTGIIEPSLHSGMFQDSVLYMKYRASETDENSLDFRYFPKGMGDTIETYSWSDNIKQAVIKNRMAGKILFNGVEVAPEEVKVFTPEGHTQGLISPDCYNGKSFFI